MSASSISGDFVFVSEPKAKSLSANLAHTNDLVFTQRGTLGQVAIVPRGEYPFYLISQSQMKVSLDRRKHDPNFVYQYFSGSTGQKQIADSAIQTGVPHTNLGILRSYHFPAPPLLEQVAIANTLSDLDTLLTAQDALIAKKRAIKQGAMQELLSGKRRLPGFGAEWEAEPLGDVAVFLKGKGLPKSSLNSFGMNPCIHYGELFTVYGEEISETVSRTNDSCADFRSVANDVLMPTSDVTPRGLAKASCIVRDGITLGGDILVIRTDVTAVSGTFLSFAIRNEEAQILSLVTGTTVFHLYASDMRRFIFMHPPTIDEQVAIVSILLDLDAEIIALEAKRKKTALLKQGMMQELLTGKTRLV